MSNNNGNVSLKRKITLRRKEEQATFTFSGKLKVKLTWTPGSEDLDLCLFFKQKNGEIGGVFSNEYRGKRSDLGTLDKFPYIEHKGDARGGRGEKSEQINIARLDDIETAYICIINYEAAVEGEDVTYAQEGGRVELESDSGDYLEVIADSNDEGHVYCVCSILNKNGEYALKNESKVMDLGTAFEKIPGFSLIVNE